MRRVGAILMAEEGAGVVFADLNLAQAQIEADQLQKRGLKAAAIRLDSADPEQTRESLTSTVERFGRLDILHNHAATFSK